MNTIVQFCNTVCAYKHLKLKKYLSFIYLCKLCIWFSLVKIAWLLQCVSEQRNVANCVVNVTKLRGMIILLMAKCSERHTSATVYSIPMWLTMISLRYGGRYWLIHLISKVKDVGEVRWSSDNVHYTRLCTNLHVFSLSIHNLSLREHCYY